MLRLDGVDMLVMHIKITLMFHLHSKSMLMEVN